ncbi:MAG: hypothetical protein R6W71_11370 [Bacteroidales bacterium]
MTRWKTMRMKAGFSTDHGVEFQHSVKRILFPYGNADVSPAGSFGFTRKYPA